VFYVVLLGQFSICGEMSGDEGILQSSKESVKLQRR
jgi:hypothetical protein